MGPIESIKVANTLGEGALWDELTQSLWWTDIEGCRLFRLAWPERSLSSFATPERLSSFGFVAGSGRLIAAFASGLALHDLHTGDCTWLWKLGRPGQRLNDGRVDRQHRFWCGAMAERPEQSGHAELFCLDPTGRVSTRESGITISNAISWSPAGNFFYFADSTARTIWRYAFSPADGAITGRQVFAQTPEGVYPDGATVDAEGGLWNAQWGGARVVRYAPDGTISRILDVPASQPTSVAFGGPDLDLLFVTSARHGLSAQALAGQAGAGDLFVYNAGVAGLPEERFRFESLPAGGPGGR